MWDYESIAELAHSSFKPKYRSWYGFFLGKTVFPNIYHILCDQINRWWAPHVQFSVNTQKPFTPNTQHSWSLNCICFIATAFIVRQHPSYAGKNGIRWLTLWHNTKAQLIINLWLSLSLSWWMVNRPFFVMQKREFGTYFFRWSCQQQCVGGWRISSNAACMLMIRIPNTLQTAHDYTRPAMERCSYYRKDGGMKRKPVVWLELWKKERFTRKKWTMWNRV